MTDRFATLSAYYEHLFPARPAQIEFILGARPQEAPEIYVDLGCATGTHLEALANRGAEVYGLDISPAVIARIIQRRPDLASRVVVGDMLEADCALAELLPGAPGLVYSIGNSLALLPGRQEIARALLAARRLLDPRGALALQVVNFDQVLDAGGLHPKPLERPLPDGRIATMERSFEPAEAGRVRFRTRLEVGTEVHENESFHLGLRRRELDELLRSAGFDEIEFFGDFDRSPWSPTAPATILLAR